MLPSSSCTRATAPPTATVTRWALLPWARMSPATVAVAVPHVVAYGRRWLHAKAPAPLLWSGPESLLPLGSPAWCHPSFDSRGCQPAPVPPPSRRRHSRRAAPRQRVRIPCLDGVENRLSPTAMSPLEATWIMAPVLAASSAVSASSPKVCRPAARRPGQNTHVMRPHRVVPHCVTTGATTLRPAALPSSINRPSMAMENGAWIFLPAPVSAMELRSSAVTLPPVRPMVSVYRFQVCQVWPRTPWAFAPVVAASAAVQFDPHRCDRRGCPGPVVEMGRRC